MARPLVAMRPSHPVRGRLGHPTRQGSCSVETPNPDTPRKLTLPRRIATIRISSESNMTDTRRIYLDNAATSFPKPEAVYTAVDGYNRHSGAAVGRGAYRAAID